LALSKQRDDDKFNVAYMIDAQGVRKILDIRTTYIFTRKKFDIDGTYITKSITSSFSWNDALKAMLPYDKAGNINPESGWSKYTKTMLDHRAFTFGAREIASDLLMGVMETTELYDTYDINYDITDDGHVKVLDKDGNEVKPLIKE